MRVKSDTSHYTQFLTTPFKRWVDLNGFAAQGNYMIEPSALSKSSLLDDGAQFRFECKLPSLSKHIQLVTTKDQHGKAVVNWLTGKSGTRPIACQSFKPLQTDNSYLTSHCSQWGWRDGNWGISPSATLKDRFINFPMFISGAAHWGLFQGNRFECDNYQANRIAKGDYWQIFVR